MNLGLYHLMLISFTGEHKHGKFVLMVVHTLAKHEHANII